MSEKLEDASFLVHPLTQLAAVTLAVTAGLRLVFFHFAERIWALREDVAIGDITPWSQWAMADRDGAEPQVLLLLVLVLAVLTVLGMQLLKRVPGWLREVVMALCLVAAALFALAVPPRAPMPDIDRVWWHVLEAEAGIFLAASMACWAVRRRAFYSVLAVFLLPVCLLPVVSQRYDDLSCVLAPALRLRLGFSPANVYFQYDYLLSLLAVGWHRLGGDPYAFSVCTQISFYLLLAGCFLLARRIFEHPRLAGLLLVALCAVRVYGIMPDANIVPQVTPLRIDLWIVLLAPALVFGLRHWSVGLAAGLVYFFGRSFGIFYLGSYALAVSADFLARRAAAKERLPLWRDISACVRQTAPALMFIGAGLLAARLVFGALVSDAVVTYRRLGLGMMRISPTSFYWWIAPMLAAVGWLAFSVRGRIPEKRAAASLFAVALAIGNSIYFFGRSHEHNLLNTSAPLLLCLFLGIDLASVTWHEGPGWVRWTLYAAPWLILALIAFSYSGRLVEKARIQAAVATRRQPLASADDPGPIVCGEIAAVAKDSRVFVYGAYDYWFYERCGYVPQGYVQPLLLQPMRAKVVQQANQLLEGGYKIVVPKQPYMYGGFEFNDIEAELGGMQKVETAHYFVFRRTP